jgi:hypothetical protein
MSGWLKDRHTYRRYSPLCEMTKARSTISAITSAGSSLFPTRRSIDGGCITFSKPVERKACHMRLANPRRVELWAKRYNEQRPKRLNSIHGPTERFQACWVRPMHILENNQHRVLTCQSRKLCGQGF